MNEEPLIEELIERAREIRADLDRHLYDPEYSKFYSLWRLCGEIVALAGGRGRKKV